VKARLTYLLLCWSLTVLTDLAAGQEVPNETKGDSTTEFRESSGHGQVTYQQLLGTADNPGNWLMYSGQYSSQRFSRLEQINDTNVNQLKVKWVRQFPTTEYVECSPLVVDGLMFVTLPENKVLALDAKTGLPYWQYDHRMSVKLTAVCCGKVNRGLAVLGDTLYLGTLDAKLVALDSRSGHIRWEKQVADPTGGHSITGAPLIVKDMVLTGIAGGEFGIRGFVSAYDAKTGELRWRRHTIPGEGEKHNDSWKTPDSWKIGGAPTWMTGSFDPDLNLVYWGVGNPGPDWNGEVRLGDNLYSDCVLALNADTGEIQWHFQFTPHDVHDWDACQIPVLADLWLDGRPRKLMLWGNRNAFFYALDRETGEFLHAKAFARQDWAKGIDPETGRPELADGKLPSPEGTWVSPDVTGAANWWSPSYSPLTKLFYLTASDSKAKYFLGADTEYVRGRVYLGGFATFTDVDKFQPSDFATAVRALDPTTGEKKWEYPVQPKSTSGVLSTAGNLVFGGSRWGNFFALDATTGEELWRLDLGGWVHAAPITYLVDGRQYVTIAAGSAFFTLGL
jgi:alcohol dehydrogenase (cytochrome c)